MSEAILSAKSEPQRGFSGFFAHELLKSERRRMLLFLVLTSLTVLLAIAVMTLGQDHFAGMGDKGLSRFWLCGVLVTAMLYQGVAYLSLQRQIRQGRQDAGPMPLLSALIEPSFVTAWLLIEALIFAPGAMFDSPFVYAYAPVIFLSCLQLSWRLCLLKGAVAGLQYLGLVAWYWSWLGGRLPATVSSYLPVHGARAMTFLVCGAAAGFLAYEIRRGIERTLQNLEERDHVVRIFGRYLSDEVVDDILRSPEGLRLGGKRRTITVMMTDLRGFTSLSESLPPEAVIAMLNNCLATLTEVIFKYRGTIDEFIGDAILALFGAPFADEDDPARAIACAVEMQMAMEKVNQWNAEHGYPRLEMGIGIHTGPAVVGNIGSEQRSKYGVVGSTVNLTSRIESYTVGGQILVSAETAAAAGPDVKVRSRRQIQPKGFQDPIEICEVIGIGGKYDVSMIEVLENFTRLSSPLPVRFKVLEGKDASGFWHDGEIIELSERGAMLRSAETLAPLSNLKLEVRQDQDGDWFPLQAKVLEEGQKACLLRFSGQELPVFMIELFQSQSVRS